jgi:hypothetical protein
MIIMKEKDLLRANYAIISYLIRVFYLLGALSSDTSK